MLKRWKDAVGHALQVSGAFVRMGFLLEISYPTSLVFAQLQTLVPLIVYYFVAKMVDGGGGAVGGDYFTFVIIGVLTVRVLNSAMHDLSTDLDSAIQQGRLEMLLVEPLRWRLLPFAMVQWPLLLRLGTAALVGPVTILLGADYRVSGIPAVIAVTMLGTAASMSFGILAIAVKILSKRSDPILSIYGFLAQILAGAFFPVHLLPGPLRALSWLLPQTYVIDVNRKLMMANGADLPGPSPLASLVVLTLFIAVGYALSLWVLGRCLEFARRIGVLGGY